jgi:transcriptional regulator with XRE-family HTH domain
MKPKYFDNLRNQLSAKAQQAASTKTQTMLSEMALQALRRAKNLSHERLVELLSTKQANLSRIERRTDMYVSTLRSYIEAMGGELDIVARFPEGDVHINLFHDIDAKTRSLCRGTACRAQRQAASQVEGHGTPCPTNVLF